MVVSTLVQPDALSVGWGKKGKRGREEAEVPGKDSSVRRPTWPFQKILRFSLQWRYKLLLSIPFFPWPNPWPLACVHIEKRAEAAYTSMPGITFLNTWGVQARF
jgi:hypothetical protein